MASFTRFSFCLLLSSLLCLCVVSASDSSSSSSSAFNFNNTSSGDSSASSGGGSSGPSYTSIPAATSSPTGSSSTSMPRPTSSSTALPPNPFGSTSAPARGSTSAPRPVYDGPVVTATRGCDDDSCTTCPQTQMCAGGEVLTLLGSNFCQGAQVELQLSQYSSALRCQNYRVGRGDDSMATCMVPGLPGPAWLTPSQVFVSLRCPGEPSTPLYPALTYTDTSQIVCANGECIQRKPVSGMTIGLIVGAVVLSLVLCAAIRRRRLALRQAASGGVLSGVSVPLPLYAPLVEPQPAVHSYPPQPRQQPPPPQPHYSPPPQQPQQQTQQPVYQPYTGMGAPYSIQTYAAPQQPHVYPQHVVYY